LTPALSRSRIGGIFFLSDRPVSPTTAPDPDSAPPPFNCGAILVVVLVDVVVVGAIFVVVVVLGAILVVVVVVGAILVLGTILVLVIGTILVLVLGTILVLGAILVLVTSSILKAVMSSATKAETGGLFYNAKEATVLRQTLATSH
jgi:hypothetical protein